MLTVGRPTVRRLRADHALLVHWDGMLQWGAVFGPSRVVGNAEGGVGPGPNLPEGRLGAASSTNPRCRQQGWGVHLTGLSYIDRLGPMANHGLYAFPSH
jgi:hypothetical protein